jgi:hypothetical protein
MIINRILLSLLIATIFFILGSYFNSRKLKLIALVNCLIGMFLTIMDYKYDFQNDIDLTHLSSLTSDTKKY